MTTVYKSHRPSFDGFLYLLQKTPTEKGQFSAFMYQTA